ncbi:RHS repeat-associated core domain-containing protein [Labrys neptuniae]
MTPPDDNGTPETPAQLPPIAVSPEDSKKQTDITESDGGTADSSSKGNTIGEDVSPGEDEGSDDKDITSDFDELIRHLKDEAKQHFNTWGEDALGTDALLRAQMVEFVRDMNANPSDPWLLAEAESYIKDGKTLTEKYLDVASDNSFVLTEDRFAKLKDHMSTASKLNSAYNWISSIPIISIKKKIIRYLADKAGRRALIRLLKRKIREIIKGKAIRKLVRDCLAKKAAANPVRVSSGKPIETDPAFFILGTFSLDLGSVYSGDNGASGPLGQGRTSMIDATIIRLVDGRLQLLDEDLFPVHFDQPRPDPGKWEGGDTTRGLEIAAGPKRSLIVKEEHTKRYFRKFEDGIWRLAVIENRAGSRITLRRSEQGVLESLDHPDGLCVEFDNDPSGLRLAAHLVGSNGERRTVLRYSYDGARNLIVAEAPYGGSMQYRYDDRGRLIETRKGHGYQSRRDYDDMGRVIALHTNGPYDGSRFEYDDELDITTFYPNGNPDQLEKFYLDAYDRAVVTEANALGYFKRREFDAAGYLTAEIDAEGNRTEFSFDRRGNVRSIRDGEGRETFYYWGPGTELDMLVDGEGKAWNYEYGTNGALTAVTDPLGTRTEIIANDAGQPIKIMRADGLMETRDYDQHHRLIAIRDFRGELTQFDYDAFGRLTSVADALGQTTLYVYEDGSGLDFWEPSRITRPDGVSVVATVAAGQAERLVTDGEGRQTIYRYGFGPNNILTEMEDASGGILRFGYDGLERLVRVENQLGRIWTFERDAAGRVIREEDFDGLVIDYTYDKADRLIETRHADEARLLYSYDKAGLLVREEAYGPGRIPGKDEPEEITRFWHDGRGLLVKAENKAALIEYERDAMGRVTAETVNGRRVESAYDCCGNRIERRIGGRMVASSYDPLGALQSVTIGAHLPLVFERDALGQELSRATSTGFAVNQRYDAVGQLRAQHIGPVARPFGAALDMKGKHLASASRGIGGGAMVERVYAWDKAFAPTAIKDGIWGGLGYDYDINGQIIRTRFGDGHTERFDYDAALNTIGYGEGPTEGGGGIGPAIAGAAYSTYDTNLQNWSLSAGGRVKQASGPHGERIKLDHDGRGRVIERRVERNGFRPKVWRYEWDAKDRLVRCITPEREAWRYGYDPFGRRVWKVRELTSAEAKSHAVRFPHLIDPQHVMPDYASQLLPVVSDQRRGVSGGRDEDGGEGAPVVGVAYGWDGDVISEEAPLWLDGSVDWGRATRWYYEPGGFRPMAKETPQGELFYIVTDHLGTPREMFDGGGKLAWATEYRTWGEIRCLWLADFANDNIPGRSGRSFYRKEGMRRDTEKNAINSPDSDAIAEFGSADALRSLAGGRVFGNLALEDDAAAVKARFLCPIRFQGQWEDEETALYYNRFRYYDPAAGQYASPDPIGLRGGVRPHGYVNQTSGWVDPLGLQRYPAWMPAVPGFQRHHIIPFHMQNDPFLRSLGFDINSRQNMMYLPSRACSVSGGGTVGQRGSAQHRGFGGHVDYNQYMDDRLNVLKNMTRNMGKACKQLALREMLLETRTMLGTGALQIAKCEE